jgi:hypothetical protein
MLYLNIYSVILVTTYFFKALFLIAVYAYFSYYGGLASDSEDKKEAKPSE